MVGEVREFLPFKIGWFSAVRRTTLGVRVATDISPEMNVELNSGVKYHEISEEY